MLTDPTGTPSQNNCTPSTPNMNKKRSDPAELTPWSSPQTHLATGTIEVKADAKAEAPDLQSRCSTRLLTSYILWSTVHTLKLVTPVGDHFIYTLRAKL